MKGCINGIVFNVIHVRPAIFDKVHCYVEIKFLIWTMIALKCVYQVLTDYLSRM